MKYIEDLCKRRENLKPLKKDISEAFEVIKSCFKNGNKVLICGNGGSSADSAHITGELMKAFKKKRNLDDKFLDELKKVLSSDEESLKGFIDNLETGLPTIDITSFSALNTAFSNDKNYLYSFANNVLGLGKDGDVLIAITTSGNSKNVINAAIVAKAKNMKVITLTGGTGGKIKNISDVNIISPNSETYLCQEDHISIYHAICLQLEENLF